MNKLCSDYKPDMSEEDRIDRIVDKLLPHFFPNIIEDDYKTVKDLQCRAVRLEDGILRKADKTSVAVVTKERNKFDKKSKKGVVKCNSCSGFGHYSNECPTAKRNDDKKTKGEPNKKFDKSKIKCYNCYKMGHFKSECKAPAKTDEKKETGASKFVKLPPPVSSIRPKLPIEIDCKINGHLIRGMADSGAAISVIHENVAKRLDLKVNKTEAPRMATAGASDMSVRGTFKGIVGLIIDRKERSCEVKLVVARHLPHELIIGYDILSELYVLADFGREKLSFGRMDKKYNGGVHVVSPVDISPFSSVDARVELKGAENHREVMFQPFTREDRLLTPYGVSELGGQPLNIVLTNTTPAPIKLRSGERVATWSDVDLTTTVADGVSAVIPIDDENYFEVGDDLNNTQRDQLTALLEEY